MARRERHAIADLAHRLGPDAQTLCDGWNLRDLLAHLVVRDSSPLGAPGISISALSGLTDREMARVRAWDFADLVERVRRPALWSPSSLAPVEAIGNRVEMFVHHEDIRRATPGWTPRELADADQDALWLPLRLLGRLMVRRAGVPVTLRRTDTDTTTVPVKGDGVEVAGLPSEILLFCYGRGQGQVELGGDRADVSRLVAAERGL